MLLALQVLYRIPIRKLFAGVFLQCRRTTLRRLLALRSKLVASGSARKPRLHGQKLGWISLRLGLSSPISL